MSKVVVTGATGFLGRHLLPLLRSEFELAPVSRHPHVGMLQVENYKQIPPGEWIIHLAEEPDRGAANLGGEAFVRQNVELVEALASKFPSRMIYASSGVVYGDDNQAPSKVDAPVFASDIYSKAKLLSESAVLAAGGVVVRLSNLFGKGMSSGNVMSDIFRQVPGEGPLLVRDDEPVRDFLAVTDAAVAFALLAKSDFRGIVNVGSGVGTSVRELAEIALSLAGESQREIVATRPAGRQSFNVLDISETKNILGWAPSAALKSQVREFLNSGRVSQCQNER